MDGTSIKNWYLPKISGVRWGGYLPGIDSTIITITFDRPIKEDWSTGDFITYDPGYGLELLIYNIPTLFEVECKIVSLSSASVPYEYLKLGEAYIKVGSSHLPWSKLPVTGRVFSGIKE